MFEKRADFYTQEIRIDLMSAERLAELNLENEQYRNAAQHGEFVVSVLQGNIYESVYISQMERFFHTFAAAQQVYLTLIAENPEAPHFDFVS